MITAELPEQGLVFWPVGSGDSTTIVIDDTHVIQVDIRAMAAGADEDAVVAAVVDRLVEVLPTMSGKPYLSLFVLTHADQDHCLGFADLLKRVTIGEIWASPRLWREYDEAGEEPCEDAQAFHEEAERRVAAVRSAVKRGQKPAAGDRVRIIGYDVNQPDYPYHDLPREYLSRPGELITSVDAEDLTDSFEAFIHAPFKDDCASARNDTSLAMQVTLRNENGDEGRALLFGDLAHDTIMKIFEYSEDHNRPERLTWDVLLAPHHCSKKVMYISEDGKDVLKRDVLDRLEDHKSDIATVVASSTEFPANDVAGANPPHLKAKRRYEEIVETLLCTAEYPSKDAPQPIVFGVAATGLEHVASDVVDRVATEVNKSVREGVGFRRGRTLARLGRRFRYGGSPTVARDSGLDRARQAISSARGDDASPQRPVGFGQSLSD